MSGSGAALERILLAVLVVLVIGSVGRLVRLARSDPETARARRQSLLSWWILFLLLAAALTFGRLGVCALLGAASWIALHELFGLLAIDRLDRPTRLLVYGLVPLTYAGIYAGWGATTLLVLPLASLLVLSVSGVLRGATQGYVRSTGSLLLGVILLIYGPAHAALLFTLSEDGPLHERGAGWLVYLILLTESNDIAQALIGRRFGRCRIAPAVSPNKTWEGFLGGVLSTCALALALAPFLTNFEEPSFLPNRLAAHFWPLAAGLLVAVAGFVGDLDMSAIKRDVGVKDGGDLLPGIGGALDRIDSLTLSAPCLYWLFVGATGT